MSFEGRIVYAPKEQKKSRRLSRARLLVWAAVFGFFLIIGGTVYILRFPDWQIKNIEISGTMALASEDLELKISDFLRGNYLPLIPQSSFFVPNDREIEILLKKEFPRVETAAVSRSFPDTLRADIKERTLWAIFCGAKNCVYTDKNGIVYEDAPVSTGSLILKIKSDVEDLKISSKVLEDLALERMGLIARELKEQLGMEVVGYELFSKIPQEVRITVSDGFKIYLNRDDDLRNAFGVIKTVLDEEIKEKHIRLEYIDARFGNKVFYKLR